MRRVFFFFFSSRRRHTRCSRDWSSDVCSSDLLGEVRESPGPTQLAYVGERGNTSLRKQSDELGERARGVSDGQDARSYSFSRQMAPSEEICGHGVRLSVGTKAGHVAGAKQAHV